MRRSEPALKAIPSEITIAAAGCTRPITVTAMAIAAISETQFPCEITPRNPAMPRIAAAIVTGGLKRADTIVTLNPPFAPT